VEVEERFELDRTPSPSTIQRLVDSAAIPEEGEEQDHNEAPFPWKAVHKSLTRRLGVLVDQAALQGVDILHELKVLHQIHSDFHVVDDE
jgi:hypothetical protein